MTGKESREIGKSDRTPIQLFPLQRRLAAVMLADVVGYSRLMSHDEEGTHRRIAVYMREAIDPTIAEYGGRLVRSMGDSMLVEFGSALDAVRCGLDIQQRLADRQSDVQDNRVQLRIGINTGDIIVDNRDIYGHSVNITARLETLAPAGTVCVSQSIYDQTRGQPGLCFVDKGLHRVKNIDYPIRVFEAGYGMASTVSRRRIPRRYIAAIGAAFAVAIAAFGVYAAIYSGTNARENSIIVLPFRNIGGNADDEYFADAITDDLTTDLSRLPRAFVISSATALTYKGKVTDARTIGRDNGVRYVLEGTIRRSGGTAQVNVQLVDTATGAGIWAERFRYDSTSLADLEDSITGRIGASLRVSLQKPRKHDTVGTLAADRNPLDERLHAVAFFVGTPTPEKFLAARLHAEASVKGSPDSAESWSLLGRILIAEHLSFWNNAGPEHVNRADDAVKRALAIDPANAGAHMAAGNILHVRGDYAGALAAFDKVIELDPNFAIAYAQKSRELLYLGRPAEAAAAAEQAIRRSPNDPQIGFFYWVHGRASFFEGKYEEAADWLEKSVQFHSHHWYNRAYLISASALAGRQSAAAKHLAEFQQNFQQYTMQKIKQQYAVSEGARFSSSVAQAATEPLFRGLTMAGLQ